MRKKIPYSARFLFRNAGWLLLALIWLNPSHAFSQVLASADKVEHNLDSKQNQSNRQDINVNGTVTSQETGESLPGVNVLIKGTTTGTVTDIDGNYTVNAPEDEILVFSFIGYETKEIAVNGRSVIDVVLEEDMQGLEEVVVVGYGTQKKVNVIGSITSIDSDAVIAAPVSSISNALTGRLPGAIVMQTSGEPGNDAGTIRIRGNSTLGNNQPLIVVDGIPGRDLNSLHSDDIESITVLKDASAAIYGARAANGVILVTTKSGATDTPISFNYGFYTGVISPTKLPEMADAPTYARMIREMQSYRGVDEVNMAFSLDDIAKYESGEYPWTHPNTNWYDAGLKDYSQSHHHNLSVTGGTSSISYYLSFGSEFNDGIYTNSATSYNRNNLRANIDMRINKYLSMGLNLSGSQENRMYPSITSAQTFQGIIRSRPTQPALFPNGLPGPPVTAGNQPMVTASFETGFDDDKRYRSNNILSANLKIPWVEGLSLSGYYGYDKYFQSRKWFMKPYTIYQLNTPDYLAAGNTGKEDGSEFLEETTLAAVGDNLFTDPQLRDTYNESQSSTVNVKFDYTKSFDEVHNISAFIAYEQNDFGSKGIEAYRRFFSTDQLPYLFGGGDEQKNNNGWVDLDARVNYFGRFSYNYNQTYLFQFSLRRDGSLRFAEEAGRWGNFPSVLVGWMPSEKTWWKNSLGYIDFFKLKASWGQLGNDLVPPFQYLTSYSIGTGTIFGSGRAYTTGMYQTGTPNPYITWEVANMFNFGWETTFLDNKMNFDADFFYQRRNDILVRRNASVPTYTGISLPDENFGIVDSHGMELILGYNDRQGDYRYGFEGNFAFARNKIIEYDEPERSVPWQVLTGSPIGSLLLYKSAGIFRDLEHVNSLPHVGGARPGDIIIEDYDGDGEITSDDKVLFPLTTTPEISFGFAFNFGYKNWELSGLVQGQGRALRYIYNDSRQGTSGNYFQYDAEGRWTPDNTDATKPRAFDRNEEYWRGTHITDHHYTDISYARLKNLRLNYTIPQNLMESIGVKGANVYFAGQNLWLIHSGNKIMDPESGGMGSYPIMKVMSLGAQISL
ncbi:MAG: TonB-dependent receptor [Anditalea sp.]